MKKFHRLFAIFLSLAIVLGLGIPAYAHDVPQLDRKGTISITMHMGDETVGGGTLTLYQVGKIHESGGNYSFQAAGDFANCGESFEDVTSSALAANLAKYASGHGLSGVTKSINADGTVAFAGLEVGLYLFVQNKAASGYNKAEPFLVSLPYMQDDGTYSYNVDASPKVEVDKPTPTTPPKPTDPSLPQTGQLNWPIPVLAVAGLLLFTAGWIMLYGKRKGNEK